MLQAINRQHVVVGDYTDNIRLIEVAMSETATWQSAAFVHVEFLLQSPDSY